MFRWGVLSTAKIGREQVLPAIAESTNGKLTAVASRSLSSAQALADRFSALHAFESYQELLASDTIDGVYIPLPTAHHTEWCLKAAEAGKHVLCEKPIAMTANDVRKLQHAQETLGVLISEAFMIHYHPQWSKIRDLIADGHIGTLRRVDGAFSYFNDDPNNMRNQVELGGGALRDVGVYPILATRLATGKEPVGVQASIDTSKAFGTDIYTSAVVDFGAFELSFYCSTQMALRQTMVFHGDEGSIEVSAPFNAGDYDFAEVALISARRDTRQVFRFAGVNQYKLQAEAFADAAMGGTSTVFSLEDSYRNQYVIDSIFDAAARA